MDDEILRYKTNSITICNKLLNEVKSNRYDVDEFFGGEMRDAYIKANDKVVEKLKNIKAKIINT